MADGTVKCIDNEIPFQTPSGWEWERWGNVSHSIQYGYNAPAQDAGNARMVRISDIQDNQVLWDTVPYCNIKEEEIDSYLLAENDILFARTGGTVGKSFLVSAVPYKAIYAGYLIRTRYSRLLCPQYLKYFMESQLYWDQLRNGTIATAQPNCNGKTLSRMILPIPPISEQRRIVDRLNNAMVPLERYSKGQNALDQLNLEIKEKLKKSILQEAIQGKLVPQIASEGDASILLQQIELEKQKLVKEGKLKKKDLLSSTIFRGDDNKYYEQINGKQHDIEDDIPFALPKSWQWVRLSSLANLHIGKTPARGSAEYWSNGKYPWVSISDMKQDAVICDTKEKVSEVAAKEQMGAITPKGSLIMSFKLTVGRTSILGIDAYHNEAIITIGCFYDENYICRDYLMYALPFLSNLGDSKDAIKGKTLNSKSLASLLVPLPPLMEQSRIVSMIKNLYQRI